MKTIKLWKILEAVIILYFVRVILDMSVGAATNNTNGESG